MSMTAVGNAKHLPIEIYSMMIELCCRKDILNERDKYHSALRLCLVSKIFYTMTLPTMYRTLFVDGRSTVLLLTRTLRARAELAELVQHAFLSDRSLQPRSFAPSSSLAIRAVPERFAFAYGCTLPPDANSSVEGIPEYAFSRPMQREARLERSDHLHYWLKTRAETLETFKRNVEHVLSVIAPYVRTLTILLYGQHHHDYRALGASPGSAGTSDITLSGALELVFPELLELTVRADFLPPVWPEMQAPLLQRAHIASGKAADDANKALLTFLSCCPLLTHLRLTGMQGSRSLVRTLEILFDLGNGRGEGEKEPTGLSLESLVIEPRASKTDVDRENAHKLGEIAPMCGVIAYSEGTLRGHERYPYAKAVEDWIDRFVGGKGCWDES